MLAGLGQRSRTFDGDMHWVRRTNPHDDNDEPKFDKRFQQSKSVEFHGIIDVNIILCSNAGDIHFSLPTPQPTRSRKHCWLSWLLGSLGIAVDL